MCPVRRAGGVSICKSSSRSALGAVIILQCFLAFTHALGFSDVSARPRQNAEVVEDFKKLYRSPG